MQEATLLRMHLTWEAILLQMHLTWEVTLLLTHQAKTEQQTAQKTILTISSSNFWGRNFKIPSLHNIYKQFTFFLTSHILIIRKKRGWDYGN